MRREKKRVSPFPRELPVEFVLGFLESTEQVPQIWRAIKARAHEQQGLVGLAAALRDQRESSRKLDKKFSFRPPLSSLLVSSGRQLCPIYPEDPTEETTQSLTGLSCLWDSLVPKIFWVKFFGQRLNTN